VVLAVYLLWPGWHEDAGMSPLWEFLTFTENLFVDYAKNHAFSHVWSLCVEEHFYLVLPVIVLALARKPAAWKTVAVLGFFFVLGLVVRTYELVHVLRPVGPGSDDFSHMYIERIYYPTYSRLDGLLGGVALAAVKLFRPGWWEALVARANWLLVMGTGLVGCAVWMFWDKFSSVAGVAAASTVIGFPVLSVGLAMWVCAASDARCWLGRVRVPGAQLVAMLAFSLYLTHKEVAHVVEGWWPRVMDARDWRCVVVYGVSCLVVAAALYYGVERPFLKLRDRREGWGVAGVDVEARVEPAL
jgi:peptidoglycan/LPS O-acetylase OafA/YrhL